MQLCANRIAGSTTILARHHIRGHATPSLRRRPRIAPAEPTGRPFDAASSSARAYYASGRAIAPAAVDLSIFRFLVLSSPYSHPLAAMNKRSSTSTAGAATGSKKRKLDNVQKYYAVKAGFKPGVYLTYAECNAQTSGFKGALFKSFTSKEDAEAFAAGKKVKSAPDDPQKFYAVAVGTPTGIYTDWTDAAMAIKGVKGPKYKKFSKRAEAVEYIRQYGNKEAVEALGEEFVDDIKEQPAKKAKTTTKTADEFIVEEPDDGVLNIYTDGSSLANGQAGSRAGLGVFFGDHDPRNLSERLRGEPQTNQRAELMAMQRALEIAEKDQPVRIFSDSQYSIKCVTQWALGWKRKGWKTANGESVKNQDIIRAVLALIDERAKKGANTMFQWVKGHAADRGNVAADRLAVHGAKLA